MSNKTAALADNNVNTLAARGTGPAPPRNVGANSKRYKKAFEVF